MRNILLCSMFTAGCFDYAGLSSQYARDAAPTPADLGGDLARSHVVIATDVKRADLAQAPDDLAGVDLAGSDSAQPVQHPASCVDVLTADAAATENDYTLYAIGNAAKPWGAHCVFTPAVATYLNLVQITAGFNYSQYTAGGNSPGTNVVTSYTRLRIDPVAFVVDTGDETFSISTGNLSVGGADPVSSMPYGVAMNCGFATPGAANVDLTGTPFAATTVAQLGGSGPTGMTTGSGQQIALQGGGNCGWNALGQYSSTPYKTNGGTVLHLIYQ